MGRRRTSRARSFRFLVVLAAASLLLAGCTSPQSALRIGGPKAGRIAELWWGLFGISVVVWVIVTFCVIWALVLRRGSDVRPRGGGTRTVVALGIVVPALILTAAYGASLVVMSDNVKPPTNPALTIEVVGHDWWWEVDYPNFVTANEIHIPVGRSVRVNLRTADVIHSFWVPSLSEKMDLIPSKENHTWLLANKAGVYRGQCAEFCGAEHAGMSFLVVADPPAVFQRWQADMAKPATEPTTALGQRGKQVFLNSSCVACHAITGVSDVGKLGPYLTHFGSRQILGAGVAPNDPGWLGGWIVNSQTIKPGNLMPPQPLPAADVYALVVYLEGLK